MYQTSDDLVLDRAREAREALAAEIRDRQLVIHLIWQARALGALRIASGIVRLDLHRVETSRRAAEFGLFVDDLIFGSGDAVVGLTRTWPGGALSPRSLKCIRSRIQVERRGIEFVFEARTWAGCLHSPLFAALFDVAKAACHQSGVCGLRCGTGRSLAGPMRGLPKLTVGPRAVGDDLGLGLFHPHGRFQTAVAVLGDSNTPTGTNK